MSANLDELALDVITHICTFLSLEDLIGLSRTCRRLKFATLDDPMVCRQAFKRLAPYSREKELLKPGDASSYRKTLFRIVCRREAFANCNPTSVTVLGYGSPVIFYNEGWVVYQTQNDRFIHLLNLRANSSKETVIDTSCFLNSEMENGNMGTRYPEESLLASNTWVLDYTEQSLVGLFSISEEGQTTPQLFVINTSIVEAASKPRVSWFPLQSVNKIFVRQNRSHLVFGTHTLENTGHRGWCFNIVSLATGRYVGHPVRPKWFEGCDTDSTVVFAIHGKYFYAITTQRRLEEIDFTSYYYGIRILLEDPTKTWILKKKWRRNHEEGPLDDRWSDLSLQTDEQTADLTVIEARREWTSGRSNCERVYYIEPLLVESKLWVELEDPSLNAGDAYPINDEDERSSNRLPPGSQFGAILGCNDKPFFQKARRRPPCSVHRGDNSETKKTFLLSQTKYRSYNKGANAWVDLVDDSAFNPETGYQTACLKVRIGSRRPRGISRLSDDSERKRLLHLSHDEYDEESETFRPEDIHYEYSGPSEAVLWPPVPGRDGHADHEGLRLSPQDLQRINQLMNPGPPGFVYQPKDVYARGDDHCIIYSTPCKVGDDPKRAIVMISFDAGLLSCQKSTSNIKNIDQGKENERDIRIKGAPWLMVQKAMWTEIGKSWSRREVPRTVLVDSKVKQENTR